MKKVFYDLHIHSCLSPCGDEDMTPNNIVNMARLKGLDLIAVTDHNTCANAPAIKAVADRVGLMVLFGMEVETSEEVHVLCLFAELAEALSFEQAMRPYFSDVKNQKDIYGEQQIMDETDRVTGEEQRLLVTATRLSFEPLFRLVDAFGGAFIPAHIDRESYSVLSNMGFIPPELPIASVEVSFLGRNEGFVEKHSELAKQYRAVTSSDAHFLWEIAERQHYLEVEKPSAATVIRCLSGKKSYEAENFGYR